MINSRSAAGTPCRNLDFRSAGKVEAAAAAPNGVNAGQRVVVIATTPISWEPESGSPGTPGAPIETAFIVAHSESPNSACATCQKKQGAAAVSQLLPCRSECNPI